MKNKEEDNYTGSWRKRQHKIEYAVKKANRNLELR